LNTPPTPHPRKLVKSLEPSREKKRRSLYFGISSFRIKKNVGRRDPYS